MTVERAIESYIQDQVGGGRSPKTMEWHQTALSLFQQYLVTQRHLLLLNQITESEVRGWLTFLRTTPSATGILRVTSTVATYARSARAFCHWLVRQGYLERTPWASVSLPKERKKPICLIEPQEFDRLLLACRPPGDISSMVDRPTARNRAILWVLLDTGMRVSELCGLRLGDVDREQGTLRVEGRGKEHWIALSPHGRDQLLSYLDQYRPRGVFSEGGSVEEDHLFLSDRYQPLTPNGITLLFDRLKRRAGITQKRVNPSLLRDTFAVRYLLTGGDPEVLRERLDLQDLATVKRYQHFSDQ